MKTSTVCKNEVSRVITGRDEHTNNVWGRNRLEKVLGKWGGMNPKGTGTPTTAGDQHGAQPVASRTTAKARGKTD